MALIRYPGSKERVLKEIWTELPIEMTEPLWMDHNRWEYREPFFGAGAVGFAVLGRLPFSCRAWINDIDYGLICLWQSILNDINRLNQMIENFEPNVDLFFEYKNKDGRKDIDPLLVGFMKLALHQMSYSGLGAMSGGPLGGKDQESLYPVGCRWAPENLINNAIECHKILKQVNGLKITCRDFEELFDDNPRAFYYLDPPYYEKGSDLYKYSMTPDDHRRLASLLRNQRKWVLSYDDHPFIRELYDWANIKPIYITYTAGQSKGKRPKNKEVIITPFDNITQDGV